MFESIPHADAVFLKVCMHRTSSFFNCMHMYIVHILFRNLFHFTNIYMKVTIWEFESIDPVIVPLNRKYVQNNKIGFRNKFCVDPTMKQLKWVWNLVLLIPTSHYIYKYMYSMTQQLVCK